MEQDIKGKIIEVLANCGMIYLDSDDDLPIDMDSLQWVSFIVEIEEMFDIAMDDDILTKDNISINEIIDIVEQYLYKQ